MIIIGWLIFSVLWFGLFGLIGYSSYDVNGEASEGYLLIFMILTYPIGMIAVNIMGVVNLSDLLPALTTHGGNVAVTVFFCLIGYFQYLMILFLTALLVKFTNKHPKPRC